MPRALVLNHTGTSYHYGCYATSTALVAALQRDGYEVRTVSVDAIAAISGSPQSERELTSIRFYDTLRDSHPAVVASLADASIVVVNGEGTLHGMGPRPRNLLYLTVVSSRVHGKPTYLVNHSFYPTDYQWQQDDNAFAFYQACAQYLDGAAARDPRSWAIHRQMGVECVQAFDMLPLFAASRCVRRDAAADRSAAMVLGLGVGWPPERAECLARVVKAAVSNAWTVTVLNGAPRHEPPQEASYPELMGRVDDRIRPAFSGGRHDNVSMDGEAIHWLNTIANAGLVVTGRYHHVVAALAVGTPVIGVTSNTDKVEGAAALLGVDAVVVNPARGDFERELLDVVKGVMSGRITAMTSDPVQRARALSYARQNCIWPQVTTDRGTCAHST